MTLASSSKSTLGSAPAGPEAGPLGQGSGSRGPVLLAVTGLFGTELAEDHLFQGLFVLGGAHYLARAGRGEAMGGEKRPSRLKISRVFVPRRCRSVMVAPCRPGATE